MTRRSLFALATAGLAAPQKDQPVKKNDLYNIPADLPVPVDDGACKHLVGMQVPRITLVSTAKQRLNMAEAARERTVVYCYPRTGKPGAAIPNGWDAIPGARGCTPETCSFRDHYKQLRELKTQVFGLSTQTTEYQQAVVERLHLTLAIL